MGEDHELFEDIGKILEKQKEEVASILEDEQIDELRKKAFVTYGIEAIAFDDIFETLDLEPSQIQKIVEGFGKARKEYFKAIRVKPTTASETAMIEELRRLSGAKLPFHELADRATEEETNLAKLNRKESLEELLVDVFSDEQLHSLNEILVDTGLAKIGSRGDKRCQVPFWLYRQAY